MSTVYKAISAVMADLCVVGISKDQFNQGQKFKFRGIDDVYAAVAPLLVKHGLVIIPDIQDVTRIVREREDDKITIQTVIKIRYVIATLDGANIYATVYGEAADGGDKGLAKAMSVAYKYLIFQTFCVPTEGQGHDPDADIVEFRNGKGDTKQTGKIASPATATITPAQAEELNNLFTKANTDVTKFLEHYGIANLQALPASEFDTSAAELRRRIPAEPTGQRAAAAPNAAQSGPSETGAGVATGGSAEGGAASAGSPKVGTRVSRFRGTR